MVMCKMHPKLFEVVNPPSSFTDVRKTL